MSRHKTFWNKEYKKGTHISLSDEPAEDLVGFTRWLGRNSPESVLRNNSTVFDIGCGNGRNIIFLAKEFGCKGIGVDISEEAIRQADSRGKGLPITFINGSISEPLKFIKDNSVDLALDMMTSHILREEERARYLSEVVRVLKPGGWFLFKTHLKDGDIHSMRLLKHHSADEKDSYLHPKLGVYEHVWSEKEIREFFGDDFEIVKMLRSHKHIIRGRVGKRRTVSVYMRKHLYS